MSCYSKIHKLLMIVIYLTFSVTIYANTICMEESSSGVSVDKANFPDDYFRAWVLSNINGAEDGYLTSSELDAVLEIDCSGKSNNRGNIQDLKGIEFFTNLKKVEFLYNNVSNIDVSRNTKLTHLSASFNLLTKIDISKNHELTWLSCNGNKLNKLDVSNNPELLHLYCGSNELMTIDLHNNVKIGSMSIGNQNIYKDVVIIADCMAITIPDDFDLRYVNSLKLDGTEINGNIVEENGVRYLLFAPISTDKSKVDGKKLSYEYVSQHVLGNMNVNVVLSCAQSIPTHTLAITSYGNGTISYNDETFRSTCRLYTINEGTMIRISLSPDDGCYIKSAMMNGTDIISNLSNNLYECRIMSDTSIDIIFEELNTSISLDEITYQIVSTKDHTVVVSEGNNALSLNIPNTINYEGQDWTIIGIEEDALKNSTKLSAIIWNPAYKFDARVSNPNLLLYVKSADYAPSSVNNVIVNGTAKDITLTDAHSGNDFYCPQAFTAEKISYTHRYGMKTGIGESRGWETIALPFDVQHITLSEKEIKPFASWRSGDAARPFWLYQFGSKGFAEAESIKAYTPYLISLPNNEKYVADYRLAGNVKFSAENVEIKKSDEVNASSYNGRRFVPNFATQEANAGLYALNVNNEYETYQGGEAEGSKFILNLRKVHPFEAYMTTSAGTRSIEIFDQMTTAIKDNWMTENNPGILRVYDLSGKMVGQGSSIEEIKRVLPAGVYIVNHQKIIIK